MQLLTILVATFAVGLVSFIGLFFLGEKVDARKVTFYLISLASGTMLGATFLHLIPEYLETNPQKPFILIAIGVFLFFILEKFLIWRHCHHHHRPEEHSRPVAASMILAGDAIHNFIDGIIIGAAFMTNPGAGVSITLAILLHEIPQEIGDFAVLIHGGYTVKKALLFNFISATSAVLGGVLAFFFAGSSMGFRNAILPLAAGGFLYIALADLIPQLHQQTTPKQSVGQVILLGVGFSLILLLTSFFGS